jgi:bifunctional UDP-N-acetylglucosamine pyrophosphorylase/glucosamine-1-phosphate N-acetyltransferase
MLQVVQAIILAAGKSQRFKTDRTKLIEPICGQPMILYSTKLLDHLGIFMTLVVGYQKDAIENLVIQEHGEKNVSFVEQFEQKGTGDALKCTRHLWTRDHILIMNGDVPLVTQSIVHELYQNHIASGAAVTFLTAHDDYHTSAYGKVFKSANGIRIIEARDYDSAKKQEDCCVNVGIYLFQRSFLLHSIDKITPSPLTDEYYITDLINIASDDGYLVKTVNVEFDRVRGINTLEELWAAEQIKRSELIKYWMLHGVRFVAAHNVNIDLSVTIGKGSVIGVGAHLLGKTEIGEQVSVGPFSVIVDSIVGNKAEIKSHSVIEQSTICHEAIVGPFAYCHNNSFIGSKAHIGAFVDCKKSTIGSETKAKHLSYLGDAIIGSRVNIGGGTIIANHDGISKNQTVMEDDVYIGANCSLVAPIVIGQDAFIGAGSTITENVEKGALAIGRARQVNKPEYAYRLKQKKINLKKINKGLLFEPPFDKSIISPL